MDMQCFRKRKCGWKGDIESTKIINKKTVCLICEKNHV